MVGNNENILVEFDYNNITVVDPNKVIDDQGRAKERNIKQENLVFYANLECKVLPRTKLAVGVASNDAIQTVSIATINFLKQGDKEFLDNSYTDEITGKDTISGKGVNQIKQTEVTNPQNNADKFIRQTLNTGGKPGAQDNGLLGITSINVRQDTSFLPVISVTLEDVKGRALFEGGDNSPYAAFFNLPYPLFHLTLKGYYGKAIKLSLMLQNFSSRFDTYSGNFKIDLKFYTYKYTVLSEIPMAYLMAVPHMYKSRVKVQTIQGNTDSQFVDVKDGVVERGYQKVKEMYSEYKSKGMIPDDFPEITLVQMYEKLENFLKNELDKFTKQNLDPLTDLDTYQKNLNDYKGYVYYFTQGEEPAWAKTYLDETTPIILKNGVKVLTFKKEYNGQKKEDAKSKLKSLIDKYNELLKNNKTVGENGSYTINGKTKKASIPVKISYDTFLPNPEVQQEDIDLKETYKAVTGKKVEPTDTELAEFKAKLVTDGLLTTSVIKDKDGDIKPITDYFYFETPNTIQVKEKVNELPIIGGSSFIDEIDKMGKQLKVYRAQIEQDLTEALAEFIQSKDSGLGFVPNIRNVLAVFFASGEAFLRLMDDVHTKAWEQRNSPIRKQAVLKPETQGASQDNVDGGGVSEEQPIYPWPQVIEQTTGTDGHELYEIVYPGDVSVIGQTKAFLPDVWPEVEFVEEFISGFVEKASLPVDNTFTQNEQTEPQRVSLNAIEFPVTNDIFSNKEEVKFFYELYERVMFISNYSRLLRSGNFIADSDKVSNIIADGENINILKSLSNDNPFLIQKLKEYAYTGNNFESFLRHISNQGTGESWQNFIRGIYNTKYIKNKVDNSEFQFITTDIINNSLSQPLISLPTEGDFIDYISGSTTTNTYDFADTYPFTNKDWGKKYLANGNVLLNEFSAFDTRNILTYNPTNKIITNIDSYDGGKKLFTHFLWEPQTDAPTNYTTNTEFLKNFYKERALNFNKQLITEGNLNYKNYTQEVDANQTVSILNTPYFTNAIQKGVENYRNYDEYPFVEAAYLFINSLPIATLREKYKTKNEEDDLNYIFATLKKFGGVHKLPYSWIVKYGSIWHRYKKYVETGVDMLDSVWIPFNYVKNFDPVTEDPNKMYTFSASSEVGIVDMVLGLNVSVGIQTSTTMNSGFYPKVINDFNVFYQGFEIFSGYTSTAFEEAINSGFTLNYVNDAIIQKSPSFDPNNLNRDLRVIPWSVYIKSLKSPTSYLMPSEGSLINQTNNECFDMATGQLKTEVLNNQAVYDGSVRSFWSAPNYGYYDSSKVVKPDPIDYLKQIFSGQSQQENFSINGETSGYTQISEMFSVFEKEVLDLFEVEFLKFSKSKWEIDLSPGQTREPKYSNFQLLMTDIMSIEELTGDTGTEIVTNAQSKQLEKLTTSLKNFLLNNDVIIKYGNPSQFNKRLFYTFSNYNIVDPYTYTKYSTTTPNSLPVSGGSQTLLNSKTQYPAEWSALETYVGFSEIPELVYKNNGSYITDFFIDMNVSFSVDNIINFAPIIKIYATQKLNDDTLNRTKFINLMDEYIQSTLDFKNKVFDNLIIKVQKALPNVDNTVQGKIVSKLEGEQTKVELWESFKALNDKWISGADFKTKTLFEDVLLLDRASRNIGEKVLVDIAYLKDLINPTKMNTKATMQNFIQSILIKNNFIIMNLPSYVNFYNVQDAVKNPTPRSEGTLEFANTLFGTFMNVDYRESSAKMVCFYGGKPSEQLDLKDNVDFRYRNDAFELRRASDNPLVEDLTNKKDWDKSNKVVGFNVDIGPQNQSIFYGFQVAQDAGKATAESLEVLNQMANQGGNRAGATQNFSLYNLYKNRSYTCTISMMGNALIQPTMYFNLRHVPMFSGPYMITSVNHTISPGTFETIVEGVRQPIASLPKLDNYLQSLKTNLMESIKKAQGSDKQQKENESKNTDSNSNVDNQKTGVENTLTSKDSTKINSSVSEECTVLSKYASFTPLTGPGQNSVSYQGMKDAIVQSTSNTTLRYVLFAAAYLNTGDGSKFKTVENNYFGISLSPQQQTDYWGAPGETYFLKHYYCSPSNISYATFNSFTDSVAFMVARWNGKMGDVQVTKESITKFLILYNNSSTKRNDDVYTSYDQTQKANLESSVEKAINDYNAIN